MASLNFFFIALAAGLALQWAVLVLVQRPRWLATPNERSSHSVPTPTMGGIGFVLVALGYLFWMSADNANMGWGLIPPLLAVALIGFIDDLGHVPAALRLMVHFAAAAWLLSVLPLDLPLWMQAFVCVGMVWLVNLYNFMDGIDGIAAIQCLTFVLGVQWVAQGVPGWAGELLWLLGGSVLAFLAFNWPPAKIFMGDVGSGFLGLLLGVMVVYLWANDTVPLVASLILLAVFWFDATYTLCVRIASQQEFTQAHRSHLYQHLAQRQGHLWTTVAVLVYAMVWLTPLAWYAARAPLLGQGLAVAAACLPLAVLCWRFKAGMAGGPGAAQQPVKDHKEV